MIVMMFDDFDVFDFCHKMVSKDFGIAGIVSLVPCLPRPFCFAFLQNENGASV